MTDFPGDGDPVTGRGLKSGARSAMFRVIVNVSPLRLVLALVTLWTSPCPADEAIAFDGVRALRHVAWMLEAGQRHYGAPRRDAAIARLAGALASQVDRVEHQRFRVREAASGREYELTNLIGRRNPGASPRLLLGSHYDTRLWAEQDPTMALRGLPIPGANDGTSGVAVLLELLRVIEGTPELRDLGIDVVFFDGEEFGRPGNNDYCQGSLHFVRQLEHFYPASPPFAAIVLDMVGDRELRIRRERSSNAELSRWLSDEIWRAGERIAPGTFVDAPTGPIVDDQSAFQRRGIPAVLIIDLEYPHWHTHQDSIDKLSSNSLQVVGRTLASVLPGIIARAVATSSSVSTSQRSETPR